MVTRRQAGSAPGRLRSGGYTNDTLTLRVPTGHTLDDLDGLSLWD